MVNTPRKLNTTLSRKEYLIVISQHASRQVAEILNIIPVQKGQSLTSPKGRDHFIWVILPTSTPWYGMVWYGTVWYGIIGFNVTFDTV